MRCQLALPVRGRDPVLFTDLRRSGRRLLPGRPASGWAPALVLALLINGFLFLLLPLLTPDSSRPLDLTEPHPVRVVRVSEKDSPAPPEEAVSEPPVREELQARGLIEPDLVKPALQDQTLPPVRFQVTPNLILPAGMGTAGDPGLAGGGAGRIYNLEDVEQGPVPLGGIKPLYPLRAKRLGIEGVVKVRFVVDEQGNAGQVRILEAAPEGVFEDSVLQFLAACRFSPASIGGRPVASIVMQPFRFELD